MITLSTTGTAGLTRVPPRSVSGFLATLVLVAPAVLLAASPNATELLSFDRSALADGEWWRMVTCHWTHWSLDHLLWDMIAFAVLVPLCWRNRPVSLVLTLGLSSVLIPAVLWFNMPAMAAYRGLSGLDSALFMLLAGRLIQRAAKERDHLGILLFGLPFLAFAAKVGYEWLAGRAVFTDSGGFVPVPLAHVVGGACGLLFAWLPAPQSHAGRSSTPSLSSGCAVEEPMLPVPRGPRARTRRRSRVS